MPLMKCGHSAQGRDAKGNPVCTCCYGIKSGATEIAEVVPNLVDRKAKCGYCNTTVPSDVDLAFFESRPTLDKDSFYCGCRGWD